ncbi:MAG: ATPase domain-containing protein [Myxococcota bacterium]
MLIGSGIHALDEILGGGLESQRMYLISGDPGSGKTTLGLQFLLEGLRRGERGLFITLSETREELLAVAASHGWSLDGMDLFELAPPAEASLDPDQQYRMFHPSEVELTETTRAILEVVERTKPKRVVFDSLSEMRLLAQNPLRYRRQVLALKHYFVGRDATILLLDDRSGDQPDSHLESLAHGVIALEMEHPEYGAERRRLRVIKMRGRPFRGGHHDYRIRPGGLDVFPRLVAAEHREEAEPRVYSTGMPALDALLGGGIDAGTSTLIMGAAGTGKSTLAVRCIYEAVLRGESASLFLFEELPDTLMRRCDAVGMPLAPLLASGRLRITQVDPAELSAGEFCTLVRREVEGSDGRPAARMVLIDSLNGYLQAMPEEKFLVILLHELLAFLAQRRVATFLVLAQTGLGGPMHTPVDASYLADTIVLLRYFEAQGAIRQALSVVKKRSGPHERTIREVSIGRGGLLVGEPLTEFQGVLTGVPNFVGAAASLRGKAGG